LEWTEKPVPYVITKALDRPWQRDVLCAVRGLSLPDCWIAAGFVRNAVWDLLHNYTKPTPLADIDVLFYLDAPDYAYDEQELEGQLRAVLPQHTWQVRNQARMHHVNGFRPFLSSADAMCHWVETPTAIGVSLDRLGRLQINAPLGVGDLLGLRLQPGPHFRRERLPIYRQRVRTKGWAETWPNLRVLGF
jgi:hypothetical protein